MTSLYHGVVSLIQRITCPCILILTNLDASALGTCPSVTLLQIRVFFSDKFCIVFIQRIYNVLDCDLYLWYSKWDFGSYYQLNWKILDFFVT